jgi:signal transduction histidine kinase/ligand-binding sensor domain-containing protein
MFYAPPIATRSTRVVTAILVAVALLRSGVALARGRLIRQLDAFAGLHAPRIAALAQDSLGFLWIGSHAGVERFDGNEIRSWARDVITAGVLTLRAGDNGSVYVIDDHGRLFLIDGDRTVPIIDERGRLADATDVLPLPGGGAWIAAAGAVRRRDHDGRWSAPIAGLSGVNHLRAAPDGTVYAASDARVWRISDGRADAVATADGIVDFLVHADQSLVVAQYGGAIISITGGQTVSLIDLRTRAMSLAQRGDVLWAAFDNALVAFRPGQAPEVLRRDQGIRSGGPLVVDREGGLWVGTFEGILELPEPETRIWSDLDGLPEAPRFLTSTDEGVWIGTWHGLGRVEGAAGPAHREGEDTVQGALCRDGHGRMWTSDHASLVARIDGRFVHTPFPAGGHSFPEGCASAPDGSVWLTVRDRLFKVPADGGPPVAVTTPPGDQDGASRVFQDHRGRVWFARNELVCWANAARPIEASSWSCRSLAGAKMVHMLAETERGTIWAATMDIGVLRFDERSGAWVVIPGSTRLSSLAVTALRPSPRGGLWVAGHGVLVRVQERPELADGWEIVETVGIWNGVPSTDAEDILEEPGGALWIAQDAGVARVPRAARDDRPTPPRVTLIDVRVDGRHYAATMPLDLAYRNNRLELDFAGLSYRDPTRLRYRVRLDRDDVWSEPTRQPSFRFVDLPPGTYRAEVSASLDGVTWSEAPASFTFTVGRPWYLQWWAFALAAIVLAVVAFTVHRIRLAMRRRLERQRAHIAMDLHDEMGSGLGSIGILAAIASDEDVPDGRRRSLASEIIEAAEELGESLGDIVWSLRSDSSTLEALIAHIVDRAGRLLPNGTPALRLELPSPPPTVPLSLQARRAIQLICYEALHNVARHAGAQRVVIGLGRADRRLWRLWIEDDGVGLGGAPTRPGGGLGLSSMRRRAAALGATLTIGAASGGGTRVELIFEPGAPGRARDSHEDVGDETR